MTKRIEYKDLDFHDSGQGKPVIMIPGMEGTKEFWRNQWDVFSKRYRVVACSYPRFKPELSRTVSDYAREILGLMDSLGIDRAAVMGESFGGAISQELAVAHGDRVAALVLCNTMDRAGNRNFGLNRFTLATLMHPTVFLMPQSFRKPFLNWVGRQRGFVMDSTPGNERLADYILEWGLAHGWSGYLDRLIAGMKMAYTDRLATIKAPTLVLRGTEDRIVDAQTIVGLVGRIPGAELVLIEGGGHCCQYTLPEASNEAVLSWLDRIGY